MGTIKELNNFSIGWRFTDENYNIVKEDDLPDFKIFKEQESQKKWKEFTKSTKYHITEIEDSFFKNLTKISSYSLDKDYNEGVEILNNADVLSEDDRIIIFWGGKNSIEVSWKIFVLYWDDFCYPSDDNLIVCNKKEIFMIYQDEFIYVYKKDKSDSF